LRKARKMRFSPFWLKMRTPDNMVATGVQKHWGSWGEGEGGDQEKRNARVHKGQRKTDRNQGAAIRELLYVAVERLE
jgi:hypothetical protein